jgi:hypothetical protein
VQSTGVETVKSVIAFFTKYPLLGEKMVQMELAKERMEAKRLEQEQGARGSTEKNEKRKK